MIRGLGFAVLARRGEGLGARLAGVRVVEAGAGDEAASYRRLLAEDGLGVLAVDQEVLDLVPADDRRRKDRALPVVIPYALPRRWSEAGRGRDYVAALIRRAVGYHVKLGEGSPR
jgi:V/A-type H+-transporting ATPase subunit F